MVFPRDNFGLRTFTFRAKMQECEGAKAKVGRCDGEARRCEDKTEYDGAKAKGRFYYCHLPSQLRNLSFETSHFRL